MVFEQAENRALTVSNDSDNWALREEAIGPAKKTPDVNSISTNTIPQSLKDHEALKLDGLADGAKVNRKVDEDNCRKEPGCDKGLQQQVEPIGIKGIDISNIENTRGPIDFNQIKNAGYQFVFLKASEGNYFVDKYFDQNRQGARDAGLKLGYYHYFHPGQSVQEQVDLFCKTIGKVDPDVMRIYMDVEDPLPTSREHQPWGTNSAQNAKMIEGFIEGVKDKLGTSVPVELYTYPNFVKERLANQPELAKYPLFIANYRVDKPTVPAPWKNWDIWQYTSVGHVPGIEGPIDLDVLNGTDLNLNLKGAKKA